MDGCCEQRHERGRPRTRWMYAVDRDMKEEDRGQGGWMLWTETWKRKTEDKVDGCCGQRHERGRPRTRWMDAMDRDMKEED